MGGWGEDKVGVGWGRIKWVGGVEGGRLMLPLEEAEGALDLVFSSDEH